MRVCHYVSNKGKIKNNNEDSFQINNFYKKINEDISGVKLLKGSNLISICDGLGGEELGEVAADIAVREMARISEQVNKENLIEKIDYEYDIINSKICNEIEKNGSRIGTTIVSVFIDKETVSFFNVGDSRAYIFEKGKLTQISKDHSIKSGDGTETGAVSQHLGIFPNELIIEPYIVDSISIRKKSYILLCTDGLYKMINDEEISEILKRKTSLKSKKDELLNKAMKNGGNDNITFILIRL